MLEKIKSAYLLWHSYHGILPKTHRHSLGDRIDTLFIETIEAVSAANFLGPTEKQPYVRIAIRKIDTVKILLMICWETKSLDNKKYAAISLPIDEIGKMLGGWNGQITRTIEQARAQQTKQNSPATLVAKEK